MIPRLRLDIGWSDLLAGAVYCLVGGDGPARQSVSNRWGEPANCVVSLSVRSGFDALLTVLDLPIGSEVVVSAITIRDMVRIIEAHGLVAVPVDVDVDTLSVSEAALRACVTDRTRLILVAHLFGSRMPLDSVVKVAHDLGLLVVEDCAQAYCGDSFRGHPESDVVCFSFGPIKTATALGGAVLLFRDAGLCGEADEVQSIWPRQSRWAFAPRLMKFGLLRLLNLRVCFTLYVGLCRWLRVDHDRFLNQRVRGFGGGDFFAKIRHRPSVPLVRLLARRLRSGCEGVRWRVDRAREALARLPAEMVVGGAAEKHTHWVFPIRVARPDDVMRRLWRHGFDATRGASSLSVVAPPDESRVRAGGAGEVMGRVLYLPVAACRDGGEVERLVDVVRGTTSGSSLPTNSPKNDI